MEASGYIHEYMSSLLVPPQLACAVTAKGLLQITACKIFLSLQLLAVLTRKT
jgi:hypothetical protein